MKKRMFTAPSQKMAAMTRTNKAILDVLFSKCDVKNKFSENEVLKKWN
ncbi:MAG: hypothetical protein KBG21_06845 [Ignavibacteria bacterium]|nr:hypothetical protein [Ignavibacteria bacterium]